MTEYSTASGRLPFETSPVTPQEDLRTIALNRVSWGAILAGVVLALVVQLLLNLLGVGIGVATLNPGTADNPAASTFSIAAGVWYVVAGIIAAFVGGYLASRLSGRPLKSTGALHGLTSWAVTTLIVLYLLTTTVGSLVGGAFSAIGSAAGGFGKAAANIAETAAPALSDAGNPFAEIQQQIQNATGTNDPQVLKAAAISAVRAAVTGDEAQAKDANERAAQALAKAQNIPVDQARMQVQQWEQQYRTTVNQAKQKATEAAQTTAKIVSRGALFGFIALLLGAIAAWLGGGAGTVVTTVTTGSAMRRRP